MKARAMLKKEKEKQGRNTRDKLIVELAIGVLAEEHLSDCG